MSSHVHERPEKCPENVSEAKPTLVSGSIPMRIDIEAVQKRGIPAALNSADLLQTSKKLVNPTSPVRPAGRTILSRLSFSARWNGAARCEYPWGEYRDALFRRGRQRTCFTEVSTALQLVNFDVARIRGFWCEYPRIPIHSPVGTFRVAIVTRIPAAGPNGERVSRFVGLPLL